MLQTNSTCVATHTNKHRSMFQVLSVIQIHHSIAEVKKTFCPKLSFLRDSSCLCRTSHKCSLSSSAILLSGEQGPYIWTRLPYTVSYKTSIVIDRKKSRAGHALKLSLILLPFHALLKQVQR